MRALKIAAIVGVGMMVAGAALAGPWADPAGRVTFNAASGWVTEVQRSSNAQRTIVLTGNANNECYVLTVPNPGTASAPPNRVHALTDPMAAADWQALANSVTPMFPQHNASLTSQSVDTSGFWPIQMAQLGGAERPVLAALTRRPGVDLIGLCWTYGGPDASATYNTFFHSIGSPNDATLQATAQQLDAAHSAATQQTAQQQQAQQQAQQQQQQQQQHVSRTRNGYDRGNGPALNPGPH